MTIDHLHRSIFITNTFANAYPQLHVELWKQFEQQVPVHERTGAYGADNLAYVRWLRKINHPTVNEFLKSYSMQSL